MTPAPDKHEFHSSEELNRMTCITCGEKIADLSTHFVCKNELDKAKKEIEELKKTIDYLTPRKDELPRKFLMEEAIKDLKSKNALLEKQRDVWREIAHQYAGDGSDYGLDDEARRIWEGK